VHFVDVENATIDEGDFLIGPFGRGFFVRIKLSTVLKALKENGFYLVPREFLEEVKNKIVNDDEQ
jgi:hypothetical protein